MLCLVIMPRSEKRKGKPKTSTKTKELKSPNQLLAVKAVARSVRNADKKGQKKISLGKILRDAGYSHSKSLSPSRVIGTLSFQTLLDKYLPDETLAEVHGDLLKASVLSHYVFPASESDEEIKEIIESVQGCKVMKIRKQHSWKRAYFWTPDNNSRLKAISEAYKVKNKYPAERLEVMVAKVEITQY